MKKTNGFTLSVKDGYKADHRVAQTIKKPIYVTDSAGQMTIREVERRIIVNNSKLAYRRIKKDFSKTLKG